MGRVQLIPDAIVAPRARTSSSRAWLLDPVAFHDMFDELYSGVERAEGMTRMRWLATQVWRSTDPETHEYVDRLRTASADEWESAFHESHLVDWYRVLMASHLTPMRSLTDPRGLRTGLVDLGWTPAQARRATYGRELKGLVETFGCEAVATDLGPQMLVDSRGWLGASDIDQALIGLRRIDPGRFRDAQPLVPMVEELFAVLTEAADHPDHVLLVLAD